MKKNRKKWTKLGKEMNVRYKLSADRHGMQENGDGIVKSEEINTMQQANYLLMRKKWIG